jgi:hypothetical protein
MAAQPTRSISLSPAGIAAQWTGVLAGPIAWALDLMVSYSIVQWSCGGPHPLVLHLVSWIALLIIVGGLAASWRVLAEAPRGAAPVAQRTRFMGWLGVVSCAMFATTIVATAIPRWILDACQQ